MQSQVRFKRVPEKVALVQSQVRFNRVPEKVPEKALAHSQVRFNRICGHLIHGNPAEVFQRLASQHPSERFVKKKRCGCWGYHRSLFSTYFAIVEVHVDTYHIYYIFHTWSIWDQLMTLKKKDGSIKLNHLWLSPSPLKNMTSSVEMMTIWNMDGKYSKPPTR